MHAQAGHSLIMNALSYRLDEHGLVFQSRWWQQHLCTTLLFSRAYKLLMFMAVADARMYIHWLWKVWEMKNKEKKKNNFLFSNLLERTLVNSFVHLLSLAYVFMERN